jgi:hypothetical protein
MWICGKKRDRSLLEKWRMIITGGFNDRCDFTGISPLRPAKKRWLPVEMTVY